MRLILPKTRPDLNPYRDLPLFFLAGPVLGGGDWQRRMTRLLMGRVSDCIIVNPCRYPPEHWLYGARMSGPEDLFEHQTAWERYYLEQASREWDTGCVIFWLPCEDKEEPRHDGKPYAMDTRGEIGEWRGQMMHVPDLRVVMGAEPDFPGLKQIARNSELVLGHDFKIYDSMEAVADQAVTLADPDSSFKAHTSA